MGAGASTGVWRRPAKRRARCLHWRWPTTDASTSDGTAMGYRLPPGRKKVTRTLVVVICESEYNCSTAPRRKMTWIAPTKKKSTAGGRRWHCSEEDDNDIDSGESSSDDILVQKESESEVPGAGLNWTVSHLVQLLAG